MTNEAFEKLATQILDLVSWAGDPDDNNGTPYREGHDTVMNDVDEQATEIIKTWVAENLGALLDDTLTSPDIASSVGTALADQLTPDDAIIPLRPEDIELITFAPDFTTSEDIATVMTDTHPQAAEKSP